MGRVMPASLIGAPVVPLLVVAALQRTQHRPAPHSPMHAQMHAQMQDAPASAEAMTRANPRAAGGTVARDAHGEEPERYTIGARLSSALVAHERLSTTSWLCAHCATPISEACTAVLLPNSDQAVHAACARVVLEEPDTDPALFRRLLYGVER
jgi:hypothetical protein